MQEHVKFTSELRIGRHTALRRRYTAPENWFFLRLSLYPCQFFPLFLPVFMSPPYSVNLVLLPLAQILKSKHLSGIKTTKKPKHVFTFHCGRSAGGSRIIPPPLLHRLRTQPAVQCTQGEEGLSLVALSTLSSSVWRVCLCRALYSLYSLALSGVSACVARCTVSTL